LLFAGAHKYAALFFICIAVLLVAKAAFAIGMLLRGLSSALCRA